MSQRRLRDQRRRLSNGSFDAHRTDKRSVGRFQTVAGAIVEVHLHLVFSDLIWFTAFVQCTSHGFANPDHAVPATSDFLLHDGADETAPAAMPVIAIARKWAQQHAETCRALPYTHR
ncbi:hypothetical protein [Streptomyces lateritius]|uniref:hypothetical protein n=1 Tax=Streptomyces lateritius TaxID=67313 RepID=UPI0016788845|nr:hypothetical protein [Streptomyces lateritius]GGU12535.1 hypothetical protein GCM10010272_67100 [Streptomyces lateritius]